MTHIDKSRAPRHRVAKGPDRPQYLLNAENDRVMMIITALVSEFSALRDRLDTHEALADAGVPVTTDAVESFVLSESRAAKREVEREKLLRRIYRIIMEDLDAARQGQSAKKGI